MGEQTPINNNRRAALKALAAATGAAGLATLPARWSKPAVNVGAIPAHAQASQCVYDLLVEITWEDTVNFDVRLREPGGLSISPLFPNGNQATHEGDVTSPPGPERITIPCGAALAVVDDPYQVGVVHDDPNNPHTVTINITTPWTTTRTVICTVPVGNGVRAANVDFVNEVIDMSGTWFQCALQPL